MKLLRYGMFVLIGFMAVSCAEETVSPLRGTGPGSGGPGSGGDDDDDDPIVVPPPKPKSNTDSSTVYIVVNGY